MIGETKADPAAPKGTGAGFGAGVFRDLVDAFVHVHVLSEGDPQHQAAIRQREAVRAMIERHTTDTAWRERLQRAQEAAQRGEHEVLLLRFPSAQCSDGGRAINVGSDAWPETLTGEAADLYRVWRDELQPKSFQLKARILDYPGGNLGDAGLILSWAASG